MTEQTELQPGDLVKLKSGGPLMTYEGASHMMGDAICVWFEGEKRSRTGFSHSSLEKIHDAK